MIAPARTATMPVNTAGMVKGSQVTVQSRSARTQRIAQTIAAWTVMGIMAFCIVGIPALLDH